MTIVEQETHSFDPLDSKALRESREGLSWWEEGQNEGVHDADYLHAHSEEEDTDDEGEVRVRDSPKGNVASPDSIESSEAACKTEAIFVKPPGAGNKLMPTTNEPRESPSIKHSPNALPKLSPATTLPLVSPEQANKKNLHVANQAAVKKKHRVTIRVPKKLRGDNNNGDTATPPIILHPLVPMPSSLTTAPLPIVTPNSSSPANSVVDPRLLLFRDGVIPFSNQAALMGSSIDMVADERLEPSSSFFINSWDGFAIDQKNIRLNRKTTASRKDNIVQSHRRCSDDDSIDSLFHCLSVKSPPPPSIDKARSESTDVDMVSPPSSASSEWQDDPEPEVAKGARMTMCASEDDIGAFLLSTMSIKDRPAITEEEESREKAAMTTQEKAQILSDALGIYPAAHQSKKTKNAFDRKSMAFLVMLMKAEVEQIPVKERQALIEAQAHCGFNEFSDKRLELFLRAEGLNTKLAARRFVNYWEERKQVFGQKFTEPMTLSGALRDDLVALQAGLFRLLPEHDSFGRPITFLHVARHTLEGYTSQSMLRACFYIFDLAALQSGGNGVVQICWFKGASLFDYDLHLYDKLAYLMSSCFPVKVLAQHLCCLPRPIGKIVKPIIHSFMSKDLRARTFQHDESEDEMIGVLNTYGINAEMIPRQIPGGKLEIDDKEWVANRRAEELEQEEIE